MFQWIVRHIASTVPVGLDTGPITLEPSVKAIADAQCLARRTAETRLTVDAVAAQLTAAQERNHFAEMIAAGMRGNG